MKDIHKNPLLYYILTPVLVSLWPLLILGVYLPKVENGLTEDAKQYKKAQNVIGQILALDSGRLNSVKLEKDAAEFDYARVVHGIAGSCGIPSPNYIISAKGPRTTKGQKTQSATIVLDEIDITKFAKFLSSIQIRWANLQCEQVVLTRKKGLRDVWKINVNFKYYY